MKTLIKLQLFTAVFPLLVVGLASANQPAPKIVFESGTHRAKVNNLVFSPDGNFLISSGNDKTIRVWSAQTGKLLTTLRGHAEEGSTGQIYAMDLSRDSRWLVIGGYFSSEGVGHIRIIDMNTGKVAGVLKGHQEVVTTLSFSKDGNWLVSGDGLGEVRVWNCQNLSRASQILRNHSKWIRAAKMSPDGLRMITGSIDQTLIFWKRNSPASRFTAVNTLRKHTAAIGRADFSPDGKYLVSTGFDGQLLLWDGNTANFLGVIDSYENYSVTTLAFSPDSQKVFANFGRFSHVYELATGNKSESNHHNDEIKASAWSPIGNLIATAGGHEHDIFLWNPNNKEVKHHITGEGRACWAVGFAKSGVKIAFGQHYNPKLKYGEDRFEKIFDFETLTLMDFDPGSGDNDLFTRNITTQNGVTIKKEDSSTLKIGDRKLKTNDGGSIFHYSLIPNSNNVVVGQRFQLAVFEPQGNSYKKLHDLSGHNGIINMVAPSPDGQYLATASRDQTVRLWNSKTGKLLATLFVSQNGEWVCTTPPGYYQASYAGENLMRWHVNQGPDAIANVFPGNALSNKVRLPEFVRRHILMGNYRPAPVNQAPVQTGNFSLNSLGSKSVPSSSQSVPATPAPAPRTTTPASTTASDSKLAPRVDWDTSIRNNSQTSENELQVRARIISLNDAILKVNILVNGKSFPVKENVTGKFMFVLKQYVPLAPGANKLSVIATNSRGTRTSETLTVIHNPKNTNHVSAKANIANKPNLYMLSIGVSDFKHTKIADLNYCDDDAQSMAALFRKQSGGMFNRTEVKLLTDKSATRATITESLNWLKSNVTENDFVIVYLSAHGKKDQYGNFHFYTHDTNPADLSGTGVAWNDFGNVLRYLPGRVLMFLDTCQAGQLGQNLYSSTPSASPLAGALSGARNAVLELSTGESGLIVMASSTGNELSLESSKWGHGAFTLGLLEGLSGKADFNGDGVIHLRELDFFVSDFVIDLTGGKQHPTTVKPSTISRLPIALVK